ncbi:hypothetical protein K523DRAFT_406206, partial [Schizophyllum commune Tattone D]
NLRVTSFGGEGLSRQAQDSPSRSPLPSPVSSRRPQISEPQCDSLSVVHCAEALEARCSQRPHLDPRASQPELSMGPWSAHRFCQDLVVSSVGVVLLPEHQLTTFQGVPPTTPTKSTHKGINAWPLPEVHQSTKVFRCVCSLKGIASAQTTLARRAWYDVVSWKGCERSENPARWHPAGQ